MLKIQTGTRTIYKEKRKTNERTNEQKKKKNIYKHKYKYDTYRLHYRAKTD